MATRLEGCFVDMLVCVVRWLVEIFANSKEQFDTHQSQPRDRAPIHLSACKTRTRPAPCLVLRGLALHVLDRLLPICNNALEGIPQSKDDEVAAGVESRLGAKGKERHRQRKGTVQPPVRTSGSAAWRGGWCAVRRHC